MLIGGGMLAFWGTQEFLVSYGADHKAVEVELATIEGGETPAGNHVKLGEHWAIYGACVYAYRQGKYDHGEPDAGTSVDYCFYPIISDAHPFMTALGELSDKYDGLENVPDSAAWPDIQQHTFTVLVKTKQFKKIGAIPDGISAQDSLQGLIINQIDSLDSEEEGLVKQSFPQANLDKVLILEAGRAPASLIKSLGMMFGGLALVIGGGVWMFAGDEEE